MEYEFEMKKKGRKNIIIIQVIFNELQLFFCFIWKRPFKHYLRIFVQMRKVLSFSSDVDDKTGSKAINQAGLTF
jgi:hypothetical protein